MVSSPDYPEPALMTVHGVLCHGRYHDLEIDLTTFKSRQISERCTALTSAQLDARFVS